MKTEDLIATIASRATPVRPLASPARRFAGWFAVSAANAAAGVVVFGLRPGLDAHLRQPSFLAMAALATAATVTAGGASLLLAVPGAERTPVMRASASSLVLLWTILVGAAIVMGGNGFTGVADWPICFLRVVILTVLPGWLLFAMLRRAAPLKPAWTGAMAAAGATALAAGVMPFVCPFDDPGHALLGHLGPLLAAIAAGIWAAPRLLQRKTGSDSAPRL